ncbi:tetraacyldisaccharide 4'-kinase [Candidatus Nitrosacidococcus sp. I8]|uniref:tetraacyldisaccharide 4'-kinase n=1 Tax=Candidatus Nitrosacidococcus sp. I8 TaxID=2942908 RepID=UPI002226D3BE|nr:tetraacyldisaccharide 4'-kinase [Candidatus Nitrosacidococcus sp. I8]CAH9019493.1 Tetraacyldisaccharide 4'-kinase [Candidatus Nitrosacidococcus sp. I8]
MLFLTNVITRYWYHKHRSYGLLVPLSLLYKLIINIRKWAYLKGILPTHTLSVPVLVVGNLTVGGTGKTPLVVWLALFLKQQGYRPGVISRGYGGHTLHYPQWVSPTSDPKIVGDESVLLAKRAKCPIVVSPHRVSGAKTLLVHTQCNILLSDDGLQHYNLGRDIEILVIDGIRRFGNNHYLPAGPLREPPSRANIVDLTVVNGGRAEGNEYLMVLRFQNVHNLKTQEICSLEIFKQSKIHAIAGIGHPERFFTQLETQGLSIYRHPFPDHHNFNPQELNFQDKIPIVMTEKDAVKCISFAENHYWYLPVSASLPNSFNEKVLTLVRKAFEKKKISKNNRSYHG